MDENVAGNIGLLLNKPLAEITVGEAMWLAMWLDSDKGETYLEGQLAATYGPLPE